MISRTGRQVRDDIREAGVTVWEWRFEKADGTAVEPAEPPGEFGTQGDAESWLGEVWRQLLEQGIDQVRLTEDGAEVYGPMSLHAED